MVHEPELSSGGGDAEDQLLVGFAVAPPELGITPAVGEDDDPAVCSVTTGCRPVARYQCTRLAAGHRVFGHDAVRGDFSDAA